MQRLAGIATDLQRAEAMSDEHADDLWRDFPNTATAFEKSFATEDDCRASWIAARWGGVMAKRMGAWTTPFQRLVATHGRVGEPAFFLFAEEQFDVVARHAMDVLPARPALVAFERGQIIAPLSMILAAISF